MAKKEIKKEGKSKALKAKVLSPFDIINMMFTNEEAFDKLPNETLALNCFIINQIMGIQFPLQAQAFNDWKINQGEVVRYWKFFLKYSVGYSRTPGFVWTKGKKKAQKLNDMSMVRVSDKTKRKYADSRHVSVKDVENALEINRDQTIKDIKEFEKEQKFLDNIEKEAFSKTVLKKKNKE